MKHLPHRFIPFFLFLILAFSVYSQDSFYDKVDAIKIEKKLFLSFSIPGDSSVSYSVNDSNSPTLLTKGLRFSQKETTSIYMEWMNPLLYQVVLTDSSYADPDAASINDFYSSVVGLFGGIVVPPAFEVAAGGGAKKLPTPGTPPLQVKFNDHNLNLWLSIANIKLGSSGITNAKLEKLTKVFKPIDSLVTINYQEAATRCFSHFKGVVRDEEVTGKTGEYALAKSTLATLKAHKAGLEKSILDLTKLVDAGLDIGSDKTFEAYTISVIRYLTDKWEAVVTGQNGSISHLDGVDQLLKQSIEKKPKVTDHNKTYYKIGEIKVARGNHVKVKVVLHLYHYPDQTLTKKLKSSKTTTFVVDRYQAFIPILSSGVFYSDLSQTGFSTSVDNAGQTVVTATSSKSGAVTAMMLNYVVNTGASQILPFVQIGIDPTKERPFLLLGGGLFIPGLNRFAISGGLGWTWTPSLKSLNVGDVVTGEAQIKDDIHYEFNKTPKGYVGIQYKF